MNWSILLDELVDWLWRVCELTKVSKVICQGEFLGILRSYKFGLKRKIN